MKNLVTTLLLACIGMSSLSAKEPNLMKAETLANKPQALCFIENKGQVRDQYKQPRTDIDIKLDAGNGLSIFIGDGQMHYQWSKKSKQNSLDGSSADLEMYRMDVVLVGANKNAKLVKEEEQAFFERYYTDWSEEAGATAHSYQIVVYKDVYPKIDWVLYTNGGGLKYDFVVHPGGNPADIKLRYEGATALALEQGALKAATPMGTVTEAAPYSYEVETKKAVFSAFNLQNTILRFDLKPSNCTLIIDPALEWATYYGGGNNDGISDIALDANDNVYAIGTTYSNSNIATTGAYQTTFISSPSAFLAKFNSGGQRQWGTYYGANATYGFAITIDNNDNVFIGGGTDNTTGIATTGAYQSTLGGGDDAFLVKFNAAGQRQWGTYYGGTGNDYEQPGTGNPFDLFSDANGNIYLVSLTTSTSGIATNGSYQTSLAGLTDGYLVKFNGAGSLQWGTYFGGPSYDELRGVTTDLSGNVYIVGATASNTGIASTGAHQTAYGGGAPFSSSDGDGFMAKFSSSGSRIWSTYYGGSGRDACCGVATDAVGNPFIFGYCLSNNNISTSGSHMSTRNSTSEMFLASFNNTGVRQWGTYYSGSYELAPAGITVDGSGNVYIAGTTMSSTGIATAGAYQSTMLGINDCFIGKMSPAGVQLWGTYFGGTSTDYCYSIMYRTGSIYLGGGSSSTGLATSGAHQTNLNGVSDGLLFKFGADTVVYISQPFNDTVLCINDSIHISYNVSLPFTSTNSFTLQLSDATGSFSSPVNLATINTNVGGIFHTKIPAGTIVGTGYRLRIVATQPAQISKDNNINIRISPLPNSPTASSNSPLCPGDTLKLTESSTTSGVTYSWSGPNSYNSNTQNPTITNVTSLNGGTYIAKATFQGCTAKQNVNVIVNTKPAKPIASNNGPICGGATLNLFANSGTAGVSYLWKGPHGFTSSTQNPIINPASAADSGTYTVVAKLNGCSSDTAKTTAVINTVSSSGIYVSPNDTICPGGTATFVIMPQNAGLNPQVQWYISGNPVSGATSKVFVTTSLHDGDSVYCKVTVTGVCAQVLTIYTFAIKMHVIPGITIQPVVTVTSVPVQPRPGEQTTFTATSPNAGANPGYQWQRNGVNVFGATYATYTVNNLTPYEEVRCILTSNDVCASPKNDTSSMIVANFPTGVEEVNGEDFNLYPNPNRGSFTINGPFLHSVVTVEVINAIGQVGYQTQSKPQNGELKVDMPSAANGVYLLRVEAGGKTCYKRFTVQ